MVGDLFFTLSCISIVLFAMAFIIGAFSKDKNAGSKEFRAAISFAVVAALYVMMEFLQ